MAFNFFRTDLIDKKKVFYVHDLVNNIIAPGERALFSPYLQKVIDKTLDQRLPPKWRNNKKFISI